MEVRSLALALAAALGSTIAPAGATGEASFPLRTLQVEPPPPARVVRTPLWRQSLDVRGASPGENVLGDGRNVVAVRNGIIAFRHAGRICAFDEASGRARWCDRAGVDPIAVGGVLAYAAGERIRAVALRDGVLRWQRALRVHHPAGATGEFDPRFPTAHRLFGAGDSVLAVRRAGRGPFRSATVGELNAAGTVLWQQEREGGLMTPVMAPPFAVWPISLDGAITTTHQLVVKLGAGGGIRGEFGNYDAVLDVRGPQIVLTGGWRAVLPEEYTLTTEITVADVRQNVTNAGFAFRPDYDDNLARMQNQATYATDFARGGGRAAGVEGSNVYVRVGRRYYRYRLAAAANQHPTTVTSDGDWIAGPYDGAIYVRREDGVHTLRFGTDAVRDMLVIAAHGRTTTSAKAGGVVYIGFDDGDVVGVSARDGRTLLAAAPCPGPVGAITPAPRHVFVVCGAALESAAPVFDPFSVPPMRLIRPLRVPDGTVVAYLRPNGAR